MDPLLEIREIITDNTITTYTRLAKVHDVLAKAIPVEEPTAPGALVQMTRSPGQILTLMQTGSQWVVVANSMSPTGTGTGAVWSWQDIVDQAVPGTLKIVDPGHTNITQEA